MVVIMETPKIFIDGHGDEVVHLINVISVLDWYVEGKWSFIDDVSKANCVIYTQDPKKEMRPLPRRHREEAFKNMRRYYCKKGWPTKCQEKTYDAYTRRTDL